MNQFYVTLPSDSSMMYYPDNTVAHFKTKLSRCICVDADYEVALIELIYPITYHNFVTYEPLMVDQMTYSDDNVQAGRILWELKSGYFKDEEDLAAYLNEELKRIFRRVYAVEYEPFFTYVKRTKEMRFGCISNCDKPDPVTFFPEDVGFSEPFIRRFGIETKFSDGFTPFELDDSRLMYVYSDIVSPHLVGDVQVPLLRVITPSGERGKMTSATFNDPYYLPVARRGFDMIEININNELGKPMPFVSGKSLAILHFRRCNE
jgi:hypothetical protein